MSAAINAVNTKALCIVVSRILMSGICTNSAEKKRLQLCKMTDVLKRFPSRAPIVLQRHDSCRPEIQLDKNRFVVPKDIQFMQFVAILRKRMQLTSAESLFFYTSTQRLVPQSQHIGELYENAKSSDGILYITYTTENTFG